MKCNKPHEAPQKDAEWKNPVLKGYTLYDSICRALLKWKNHRNGKQTNGCQGLRRRWGWRAISRHGWNMTSWEIVVVMEMFCILTLLMSITQLWYHVTETHWLLFVCSIFGLQSYSPPICITEVFLLTESVPKSGKFHITFCPCFHLVWKPEECL